MVPQKEAVFQVFELEYLGITNLARTTQVPGLAG